MGPDRRAAGAGDRLGALLVWCSTRPRLSRGATALILLIDLLLLGLALASALVPRLTS